MSCKIDVQRTCHNCRGDYCIEHNEGCSSHMVSQFHHSLPNNQRLTFPLVWLVQYKCTSSPKRIPLIPATWKERSQYLMAVTCHILLSLHSRAPSKRPIMAFSSFSLYIFHAALSLVKLASVYLHWYHLYILHNITLYSHLVHRNS